MRIQKHELAEIFEGERMPWNSALNERKMNCGAEQLKLELQRKMILAQKQWARTKI